MQKMNLAIISDVFPPKCGGSGWSSFFLARALQARGHSLQVVVPREIETAHGPHRAEFFTQEREYEGLPITEFCYPAWHVPFARNYSRNERLWPRLADWLELFLRQKNIELAHAQHYLTIPATVMACQRLNVPSVATLRDYWPTCYWTTRLSGERVCPGCTELNRLKCLVGNQGVAGVAAAPVSIYMAANVQRKQKWLAQADQTLAVSSYIAANLAASIAPTRLKVLPNFIDPAHLQSLAIQPPKTQAAVRPYLLYVGKLEVNKGARLLLEVLKTARPDLPLLVAGDGALRSEIEREAKIHNLNLQILGWTDHDEVLRLMAHSQVLLFPSLWPEPLSRVLLEAIGVGAVVLALDTGGTGDIILHNQTGLLSHSGLEMANQLTSILQPAQALQRQRLSQTAREYAKQKFSEEIVVTQVEQLYAELIQARNGARA